MGKIRSSLRRSLKWYNTFNWLFDATYSNQERIITLTRIRSRCIMHAYIEGHRTAYGRMMNTCENRAINDQRVAIKWPPFFNLVLKHCWQAISILILHTIHGDEICQNRRDKNCCHMHKYFSLDLLCLEHLRLKFIRLIEKYEEIYPFFFIMYKQFDKRIGVFHLSVD